MPVKFSFSGSNQCALMYLQLTNLIISSDFLLNPTQRQLVSPTTRAEVGILARSFGLAINSGEKALIRFQFFLLYYKLSTTHKYVSQICFWFLEDILKLDRTLK